MSKPEWGTKRTCHSCGARYYDFGKDKPSCPACKTAFNPEALLKSRRKAAPEEKEAVKAKPETEVEENLEVEDNLEVDDSVLESTDDLGGDDLPVVDVPSDNKDDT